MDIAFFFNVFETTREVDWSAWVTALSTLVAVFVALFGKFFWDYFYRPQLCVEIENKRPYSFAVVQYFDDRDARAEMCRKDYSGASELKEMFFPKTANTPSPDCGSNCGASKEGVEKSFKSEIPHALYLRLKVINYGRKQAAEKVEVFVSRIERLDDEDKDIVELSSNLQWSNEGCMFYPQIHSKSEKFCDIGFITDPAYRGYDKRYFYKHDWVGKYAVDEPAFCVNVTHPLGNGDHILRPGKYSIELVVSAYRAKPVRVLVTISFSKWSENENNILNDCGADIASRCKFVPKSRLWIYRISEIYKQILLPR